MILKQQGTKAMLSNQSQTHTNVQIATNVSTLDSQATAQNDISKKDQQLAKRYLKNLEINFTNVLHDGDDPHGFFWDAGICDIVRNTSLEMGDMGGYWDCEHHLAVSGTSNSLLIDAINELLKLHNVDINSTALNFPVEAILTKADKGHSGTWKELEGLFYYPDCNNFKGDALKIRIQLMNIFVMKCRYWFEIVW
ncbi:hypothetical protein AB4455_12095 [Vibrio sp. 10N.261.46.E12]|uniref:hypothetical protein n=1 Tax=unclassified Vibrio TaxID=2614977 RepID=UPI00105627F1|nr:MULTISPECIES: hypothetical protein [unclassified Vibrio]